MLVSEYGIFHQMMDVAAGFKKDLVLPKLPRWFCAVTRILPLSVASQPDITRRSVMKA